jgi:hypothetical protein
MPSALYPVGKKAILDGDIDLLVDTIKVVAVADEDYTYSAAHDFYDDVSASIYLGTSAGTLASKTTTGGVFDAADLAAWASSLSQDGAKDIDALIIFKDTGTPGTSNLLAYIDLTTPLTPNGGDVDINWNASGIFAI